MLKFAQVYCFPTKNVHVVIWWVWGSLAVVLPDFVATHTLGPLLAFLHVSHEREVLSHACAIIIPTKQVLVSIWIGHQLYIIIYCYPLTQTNVGFLFLWRPSLHISSTLPRQVEVEDWNKVRQGGHPSIDLAQVAPGFWRNRSAILGSLD